MRRAALVAAIALALAGAGPAAGADRRKAAEKAAPPTLKDLKRSPVEIRAGETVAPDAGKARELYRGFIGLEAGDPALRLEALRRLADLELEAGSEQLAEGVGAASTREAIVLYGRLLAQAPDYERADAVLYQLARAWEAEGEPDKALDYLDQLVARYPRSAHIGEAQFRRGEILFSRQRWREADAAYGAVIALEPASEFRAQSLYKRGWAQFKLSDVEASAAALLAVLDLKLVAPGAPARFIEPSSLSRADRELVDDTLRALVIQFAGQDGAADAGRALQRHGATPYDWLVYAELGNLMVAKERYQDAAETYDAFVRADPVHERSPQLQVLAIDAYRRGGFGSRVIAAQRDFVERYRLAGPYWAGRNPDSHPEVIAQLKTNLREVARHFHATAQQSKRLEDYQEAARWYRDYLNSFPTDPDSVETNYLLADSLFESRQYGDAAAEYERTAYDYPASKRSATAGFAALVAYERAEAPLAGEARAAWHRRALDSGLRFAQAFPADPQALPVQARSVQELFNLRDYERAIAEAARLLAWETPPSRDQERIAWNVSGDAEFELGRFDRAETAYVRLQGYLPADDPQRPAIAERLAASVYKQGEARQASGDAAGAVDTFLRVAVLAPSSQIRVNAEYDAAALLIQQQQWPRAIEVLERFRRDFARHPLAAEVPRKLALAYVEAGRPGEAAVEFERIAGTAGETEDVRREALLQAADLYEKGGQRQRSLAALEAFVGRYPQPVAAAIEVRQRLADGNADKGARARWLREIVAADAAAGAARSDRTRTLAARASLELATPLRDTFQAIALQAPLKKSLAAKRKAMEAGLAAYETAAGYGIVEVTTTATFETAEMYRRLATDLLASERPKGLDADALEQYALLLEEQAYPFEEKAIELHETNATRTRDGIYDQGVRNSYTALAGLKPARYGKAEVLADPATAGPLEPVLAAARAGQPAEAESFLREALAASPSALAYDELGVVLRRAGRFPEALEAYRSAVATDPAYAPAHRNLGVLFDLYLHEPAAALAEYERYQALQPEPDAQVANWIKEVRPRAGVPSRAASAETPQETPP